MPGASAIMGLKEVTAGYERPMTTPAEPGPTDPVAALHHLTGPQRGATSWLSQSEHAVVLGPGGALRFTSGARATLPEGCIARLRRTANTYLIEACGDRTIWVNRSPADERQLTHGDSIEFCEDGPISRFELVDDQHPLRRTLPDILEDTRAYLRVSRRPLLSRLVHGMANMWVELAQGTTLLFRASVVIALIAIAMLAYRQGHEIDRLQDRLAAGQLRLEALATGLATAEREALRRGDLAALQQAMGERITAHEERLSGLELQSRAGARVVAAAAESVAFLQGSFGFRDPESGRMLRFAVDASGRPVVTAFGNPVLTIEGDGPIAEREFTGTGFAIGDGTRLITNRHVARPWENDAAAIAGMSEGLEPLMVKFLAYLPGAALPAEILSDEVAEDADLALLTLSDPPAGVTGLALADGAPAVGQEVIALGYATGLRALLAQSGGRFLEGLQAAGETGFWEVSARLAAAGYIKPLASGGIISQISASAVVFDADTTHGGSGGPVLDLEGRVVAVQSAIVPDYGGSNIGVPVTKLVTLLGPS